MTIAKEILHVYQYTLYRLGVKGLLRANCVGLCSLLGFTMYSVWANCIVAVVRNMKLDSSGEMGESECFPLKLCLLGIKYYTQL